MSEAPSEALLPYDEPNRQLERNVRPRDWVNPTANRPYHLVVIGAGTAGLVTAAGAAGLGARVALVERDLMGGDCLNVGCVPSKGLISAARDVWTLRQALSSGQVDEAANVDFARIANEMRQKRADISPADSAERFRDLGVDVFLGSASFEDESTVSVTGHDGSVRSLTFRKAVIATGARAAAPPIDGLEQVPYLTNETLFSLTELPASLGVIGGGPIGSEMAQTFARLGSRVTLFERSEGILSKDDPDAAKLVAESLQRDGVTILNNTSAQRVSGTTGSIKVSYQQQGNTGIEEFSHLLIAVGRAPNIENLGLEKVRVEFDKSGVVVNDFLQTSNARIFAAGDVCSTMKFTHAADFQARIVIQNALFALGPLGRKRNSDLTIPWATYTSPELAHVGLTTESAQQQGIAIDTYTQSLDEVDRAILEGTDNGFVRIHTREGSDKIVGATIVAEHAGDMISEVTLAMSQGVGLSKISSVIHPYPTVADAIRKLGDQYNRTRLTPMNQRLLNLLRWFNVGG